ncbi:Serine/threonine-protein phosphatase 2B catalytic subunit alpha [Linnemannia zychae]|nr:Serine/threonine-protein phosphatase 2B catalytic subunit alpha [Linnemannia zychae]
MTHTLKITVHEASDLEDVERFGKNDPYVRVAVDIGKNAHFEKTKVVKNAGKKAAWNETLTIQNFKPQEHPELYVEVMDDETLADEPIGYCAIPLYQVLSAPGHAIRGHFHIFNMKGKEKGEVFLTIAVIAPGAAEAHPTTEIRGTSHIITAHEHRMKSLKQKESASDGAALAAGIGLAVGAKFLLDQHKGNKQAAKDQQQNAMAENRREI